MNIASIQTSIGDDEIAREQIFDFIKEANKTSQLGPVSWNTALKFLRARKFNLKSSLDLFEIYQRTRLDESLIEISPFEIDVCRELLSCKVTVLPARGADGAAVILVSVRLFTAPVSHTAFLRSFVYQMDVLTEKKEVQLNGVILLVDFTDAAYNNVDLSLAMKVYNIVNGAYPARLKNIFIVDAPLWFRAAFKTVSTVFRRKMADRVVFTSSTSELVSRIGGRQALPAHLGGNARVDHHAWFEQCILWHPDSSTQDIPRTLRQASSLDSPNGSKGSRASHGSLNIKGLTISIVKAAQPGNRRLDSEDSESDKEDVGKGNKSSENGHAVVDCDDDDDDDDNSDGGERKPVEVGHMTPNELVDYVLQLGESGMRKEYAKLRAMPLSGSCSVCRAPENILKNRYTDVPCYDSTRVRLNATGSDSDYIHANFVSLAYQPAALICTQAPLDNTIGDFWAMIWQYQVRVIVMTTKLQERGRTKCSCYWPSASGAQLICQPYIVSTMTVDLSSSHWTISTLSIVDTLSGAERTVFHLFFHSWPDFGIPDVGVFVDFLDVVDKHVALANMADGLPSSPDLLAGLVTPGDERNNTTTNNNNNTNGDSGGISSDVPHSPIVIHCSAGIGRAGTFCVVWHCRHQLAISDSKTPRIDLMSAVHAVRSMRALAVQTADQFGFSWLTVIEICRRRGLVSRSTSGVAQIIAQLQS